MRYLLLAAAQPEAYFRSPPYLVSHSYVAVGAVLHRLKGRISRFYRSAHNHSRAQPPLDSGARTPAAEKA